MMLLVSVKNILNPGTSWKKLRCLKELEQGFLSKNEIHLLVEISLAVLVLAVEFVGPIASFKPRKGTGSSRGDMTSD